MRGRKGRLPASLLEEMNNDENIVQFDAWRTTTDTDILGIPAHYDEQTAAYAPNLENE